jgi:hypothetical protein
LTPWARIAGSVDGFRVGSVLALADPIAVDASTQAAAIIATSDLPIRRARNDIGSRALEGAGMSISIAPAPLSRFR